MCDASACLVVWHESRDAPAMRDAVLACLSLVPKLRDPTAMCDALPCMGFYSGVVLQLWLVL